MAESFYISQFACRISSSIIYFIVKSGEAASQFGNANLPVLLLWSPPHFHLVWRDLLDCRWPAIFQRIIYCVERTDGWFLPWRLDCYLLWRVQDRKVGSRLPWRLSCYLISRVLKPSDLQILSQILSPASLLRHHVPGGHTKSQETARDCYNFQQTIIALK